MVKGFLLACSTLLWSCWVAAAPTESPQELRFFNWPDYIDAELVRRFEQRFHCTVKLITYETDELKNEQFIRSEGLGIDLLTSSGTGLISYQKQGWLAPITAKSVPNLQHIDPRFIEHQPEIQGYAVPYFWGSTGIAYRRDKVTEPVNSWNSLFKPKDALKGRIMMINDAKETIGLALKTLGYSLNSVNPTELRAAGELLHQQKPFVNSYSYISLENNSELINGSIWMAMVYNGDGLALEQRDPNIQFTVPTEGSILWVDYFAIPERSTNKDLALKFINFMHEPENAAQLVKSLHFASANRSARQFLPDDILNNRKIYLDAASMAKSEFYQPKSIKSLRLRNNIFAEIIGR